MGCIKVTPQLLTDGVVTRLRHARDRRATSTHRDFPRFEEAHGHQSLGRQRSGASYLTTAEGAAHSAECVVLRATQAVPIVGPSRSS
jgi:hypothetical protein